MPPTLHSALHFWQFFNPSLLLPIQFYFLLLITTYNVFLFTTLTTTLTLTITLTTSITLTTTIHSTRPELCRSSVEMVAPGDYMVRPPQPPVYFFVIDVSAASAQSGNWMWCNVMLCNAMECGGAVVECDGVGWDVIERYRIGCDVTV